MDSNVPKSNMENAWELLKQVSVQLREAADLLGDVVYKDDPEIYAIQEYLRRDADATDYRAERLKKRLSED